MSPQIRELRAAEALGEPIYTYTSLVLSSSLERGPLM